MPPNVTAICLGKSTYARVGVIANTTPLEAEWQGESITLEFSNAQAIINDRRCNRITSTATTAIIQS